jgi:LytS/YehU family sensor histidine kinase
MRRDARRAVVAAARSLRLVPALGTAAQVHALANTLSLVAAVSHRRPQVAEELLLHVAGFLRGSLRPARPVVRLTDEMNTVLGYVAVERARLGSRLRLTMACDREAQDALVPPLTVQPLVENAIRHGVAKRVQGGRVHISARLRHGRLIVAVADNGPGINRAGRGGQGWGLATLRLRLEALWGPSARVRTLSRADRGTIAAVSLPATFDAGAPSAPAVLAHPFLTRARGQHTGGS